MVVGKAVSTAQALLPERVLSTLGGLLATKGLSDASIRMLVCLVLNASNGAVDGLATAELAERAGMEERAASSAITELVTNGHIKRLQARPYKPNRYEIIALMDGKGISSGFSDPSGSGPLVGVSEASSGTPKGSRATSSPPKSDRRGETQAQPEAADDTRRAEHHPAIWHLTKLRVVPPSVWHMMHEPPEGSSADDVYLAYRYLDSVVKLSPPREGSHWGALMRFLRGGKLNGRMAFEKLHKAITEHPKTITYGGERRSLLKHELAVLNRKYGIDRNDGRESG